MGLKPLVDCIFCSYQPERSVYLEASFSPRFLSISTYRARSSSSKPWSVPLDDIVTIFNKCVETYFYFVLSFHAWRTIDVNNSIFV